MGRFLPLYGSSREQRIRRNHALELAAMETEDEGRNYMRLIDADALLSRLKQPTVEDINEVLRIEYDNAPNDAIAAEAIHNMYETVREAIKDAPTIESPRWTPCADGIPEDEDYVLITAYDDEDDQEGYVTIACYEWDAQEWVTEEGEEISRVNAWQQKPKPWRKG